MHVFIRRPLIHADTVENLELEGGASLSSGPGAIMFEPGPQPRIRRAPVRAIATITWEGGPREVFGQVLNISPGGCLLKTETTIESGTELKLSVMLIGQGKRVSADMRGVVRRLTKEDGRRAYGVEWVAANAPEKESAQWLYGQACSQ